MTEDLAKEYIKTCGGIINEMLEIDISSDEIELTKMLSDCIRYLVDNYNYIWL